MKKVSLLITALFISASALASEQDNVMSNLTIAAAETGATQSWAIETQEMVVESRLEKTLEDKAQALNDAINAKLEKSLDEKLSRELQY